MVRTGDKVKEVISQHLPIHLAGVVLSYLFDTGIKRVKEITDKEIAEMGENGLMTKSFVHTLVETARDVARQCDLYDDILPFVVCQLPMANCQVKDLVLWKNDGNEAWDVLEEAFAEDIEWHFGYEWDEVDRITMKAVVVDVQTKEND